MRRVGTGLLRSSKIALPCAAALLAAATLTACGDASDPDPVTIEKLKAPGDLRIIDNGDGAITLTWSGANNEDDFDGYNVYGMKGEASALGVTEGAALELLDGSGEAVESAKAVLANFNFAPATGLESVGAAKDAKDKELAALPIHTLDGEDPLLPTCKHDGSATADARGNCVNTTKDNFGTAVEDGADGAKVALNASISYALTGLKPGSNYCFLIMSSMDKGKKVSSQSSNVACINPRFKATANVNAPSGTAQFQVLNPRSWVAACTTTCAAPGADDLKISDPTPNSFHQPTDPGPIYIEKLGNDEVAFVAGKNSAIHTIGFRANGFASADIPPAPQLAIGNVFNQSGYSLAGQSVRIEPKTLYVFAIGDPAATTSPTNFQYQYVYVNTVPTTLGGKFDVEFRLTKNENQAR